VADTTVVLDGQILGKAQSDDEAMAMLESLSGRGHEVMTRFAIASTDVASAHAQTVVTRVRMARLPRQCLHAYVASGEWRDKAGAYAIQGAAEAFVEGIEGSFSNVVGLPAHEVFTAVRRLLVDAPSLEQPPS
jgi:septum formation protein